MNKEAVKKPRRSAECEKKKMEGEKLTLDSPIEKLLEKLDLTEYVEVLKQQSYKKVKDLQYLSDELPKKAVREILLEYVTIKII